MNKQEIINAINEGKRVFYSNTAYEVKKDRLGQFLIICSLNNYTIGLHGQEGTEYQDKLNGLERDFFIQ